MKKLLKSVQYTAKGKDSEIRVYCEGDAYIIETSCGGQLIADEEHISSVVDNDFLIYHGKSAVDDAIYGVITRLDQNGL